MFNATLTQSEASCSTQLYYMLVMLCNGTALTRVVNAGAQEGLEAWRCLVLHHEPTSLTPQCGSVARALELQLRGRDGGSSGTARPRHRPLRESERRDVPRDVARRTVETTLCPQQCSVDHVGDSESRDRQCQTRTSCSSTPQAMDLSAHGTQELDSFPERQIAAKAKAKDKGKPKDTAPTTPCPIRGKTAGTTSLMVGRTSSARTGARAKTPANIQHQGNKDKKSAKCWNCNGTGRLFQRFSEEDTELDGCGESRTTVFIQWCNRRDNVEWFLLECLRGRDRAEQLRIKEGVLVTGIDSGAARSLVLAGEISGYPVERDSEAGRVCTSAIGEREFDQGKQRGLGLELWTAKSEA